MKVLASAIFLLIPTSAHSAEWYNVHLPQPYYQFADGRPLLFSQFKGTRVDWGQCMDEDRILEVSGSAFAQSWKFVVQVELPKGRELCLQAIVIGLNDEEIGRSDPVRIKTFGPFKPGGPKDLFIEAKI